MKPSNEVTYALSKFPDLRDLPSPEGLLLAAEIEADLEIILNGVKRLKKSYTMRALHDPQFTGKPANLARVGAERAHKKFSAVMAKINGIE